MHERLGAVPSHMGRGLGKRLGTGTWDSTIEALAGHGAVAGGLGSRDGFTESGARRRAMIIERLQGAANTAVVTASS